MPAKNLSRISGDGIYLHIYNKGVEKRAIFNNEEDYKVFLGYLQDYLTVPKNPDSLKKNFKVHGRTFRGTPHQPKNYFKAVELIAYSLMPDHFHLLLYQVTAGSIENFIRSLCTRYSIYFNKKYKRSGSLFAGPYKSVSVSIEELLHLSSYLHIKNGYNSFSEYTGERNSSWVKPKVVLSSLGKGKDLYKDFVANYKPERVLERIVLEDQSEHIRAIEAEPTPAKSKSTPGLWNFVTFSTVLFMLLVTFSLRNIWIAEFNAAKSQVNNPKVLSATTQSTPEAELKITVTVITEDKSSLINIRQEPSTYSEKIGQAKNGDSFELISRNPNWFEVKLASQSGYISAKYIGDQK